MTAKTKDFYISDIPGEGIYCLCVQVMELTRLPSQKILLRVRDGTYNKALSTNNTRWLKQVHYGVNIIGWNSKYLSTLEKGEFYKLSNVEVSKVSFGELKCSLNGEIAFPLKICETSGQCRRRSRMINKICKKKLKCPEGISKDETTFFSFHSLGVKKCYPVVEEGNETTALRRKCLDCNGWRQSYKATECGDSECKSTNLGPPAFYFACTFFHNDIELMVLIYGGEAERFFGMHATDILEYENQRRAFLDLFNGMMENSFSSKFCIIWRKDHFRLCCMRATKRKEPDP